MQIEFSTSRTEGLRLVAQATVKGTLPDGLERAMEEGAKAARFKGSAGQLFDGFVERDGAVLRLVLVGTGAADAEGRAANCEKAGAAISAKYQSAGEETIGFDATGLAAEDLAHVLLGLRLRNWRYDIYRTKLKDEQKVTLKRVVVLNAPEGAEDAWNEAAYLADGIEFTRELVTEPANIIYPETFVERCQKRFEGSGAELIVLDEAKMEELGMGALLGVGQGSVRDSRILAIRWNGGTDGDAPIAFVGKGVTFDTGGNSMKPASGMEDMKGDMGGAAAVTGLMHVLAARKAKANVIGIIGLVENSVDGHAQRPGDIVTSMSGQTIEVLNTDAEGRLVLADALWYCNDRFKPGFVVDLATLTGAIMVALGQVHAGLFSNDDALAQRLFTAGHATGEKVWRMPLGPEYDKLLDSKNADMKNIGGRYGGAITAAQFLQRFIKETPWAHLDVAGTAMGSQASDINQSWGSGFGVRLLDRLVRDHYEA